ncbi:MAG: flagellar filament capping protein FliD [Caldilineaceae bacterium]|nr:flagellar filament capping protein FliD [Caldilineaceae bacterium]
MLNNISNAFKGTAGLTNDYYEALVTASMEPHRLAIKRAKARQDSLKVETAVYTDLDSKMNALHDSLASLRNGDSSVFDDKIATTSDKAIATASATSAVSNAAYDLVVTNLAAAHRVRSTQVGNVAADLGYTGDFTINGVQVSATATDSLEEIRDAINTAVIAAIDADTLADEDRFTASIIDGYLVLAADSTGQDFRLTATDDTGTVLQSLGVLTGVGGWADQLQDGAYTSFSLNGVGITRNNNTDITDVINGLTLNLKTAGSATITVSPDTAGATGKINSFIAKLNDLTDWLAAKTSSKEASDGTYTRGALSGNLGLRNLRRTLVQTAFATWSGAPATATYTRLDQLGIELGDKLVVSLADSSKLTDGLASKYSEVVDLFDALMTNVSALVEPYSEGSNTLVDKMKSAADNSLDSQGDKLKRMESAAARREELIRNQIAYQFAAISSYNDQGRYITSTLFSAYG